MGSSVILLTKQDRYSVRAKEIAEEIFRGDIRSLSGRPGDPKPSILDEAAPTYLISFLSPWIIPKSVLDRCAQAINFHPGPVEYPGIGCYNFALYDNAAQYGAVSHHMLPKVDTGDIVMEERFEVVPEDSVETLKFRTMEIMIEMFREILTDIAAGKPLPKAQTHWTRLPYTRRDLEALKLIDWTMPPDEVTRRVRATVYPGYTGPVMRLRDGSLYRWPVPRRAALA